jgi:hypothetical protein
MRTISFFVAPPDKRPSGVLKFGCLRELYGEGKTSLTRIARASDKSGAGFPRPS